MKISVKYFKEHFFSVILVVLITITISLSYFHFFINQNYLVEYEATCDPHIENCFIGCQEEDCSNDYYYMIVKRASDLYKECGNDITDCIESTTCLPIDHECSITYCNPEVEGNICESITTESDLDAESRETTEQGILLDKNIN